MSVRNFLPCLLLIATLFGVSSGACVANVESVDKDENIVTWTDGLNTCTTVIATEDSQISFSSVNAAIGNTNYGSATTMLTGKQNGGTLGHRSLIKFPLGTIPSDATIASASMTLVRIQGGGLGMISYYKAPSVSWSEGTVTWNTYTGATGTLIGSSPGSSGPGTDSVDVAAVVQTWVNGTSVNNGFLLDATGYVVRHATSEAPANANRPSLTVCYSSCTDGVLNGAETDVDCGGGTCAACDVGEACIAQSDCTMPNVCVSGVCTAGTCDDVGLPCGDSETPNTCIYCGVYQTCDAEYQACATDQECLDYTVCNGNCGNQACDDICRAQHPAGAALYDTLVQCVIYVQCSDSCGL